MSRRSDAPPRLRPSTAIAAAALLCALAGCLSGPDEPGEPRQVRASFTFAAVSWESYGMFVSLDEDPEARGQLSGAVIFNNGRDVVRMVPTMATMDSKGTLQIPAGEVLELYFTIRWDAIELRLKDQDGDGFLESGAGHIAGQTASGGAFADDFTAVSNGFPVTATTFRPWSPLDEMAPWEPILFAFGQPVSSDQLSRHRVLANGQEVPGKTEPLVDGALHTGARFVPDGFFPMGATIEVEIVGMENALGVPVTLQHEPMQVLADPGSILSNLGFEQALAGWYTGGDTVVVTSAGDLAPVEGASMAALRSEVGLIGAAYSRLIGYFDVPMDATALDLSLALLTPEESLPKLVEIRLHHALAEGGLEVLDVYAFDHEAAVLEPCACDQLDASPPLTRRTGAFQHQIDLSKLRGERVFLEIQLDGELYYTSGALAVPPLAPPPVRPAMLLVDGLQIR